MNLRERARGISVRETWERNQFLKGKKGVVQSFRARTSRAMLLHEATLTGGIGGELAAIIAEHAFEYLDAPVRRVASADTPVPYSPPLEQYFLPRVDDVVKVAREMMNF